MPCSARHTHRIVYRRVRQFLNIPRGGLRYVSEHDLFGAAGFRLSVSRGSAIKGGVKATLAQLVERLIRNQQVAGSIPAGGSSLNL